MSIRLQKMARSEKITPMSQATAAARMKTRVRGCQICCRKVGSAGVRAVSTSPARGPIRDDQCRGDRRPDDRRCATDGRRSIRERVMQAVDEVERDGGIDQAHHQRQELHRRCGNAGIEHGPETRQGKGDEAQEPGRELAHMAGMMIGRLDQPRLRLAGPQQHVDGQHHQPPMHQPAEQRDRQLAPRGAVEEPGGMGGIEDDHQGEEACEIAEKGGDHAAADIGAPGQAAAQRDHQMRQQQGESHGEQEGNREPRQPQPERALCRIGQPIGVLGKRIRQLRHRRQYGLQLFRQRRSRPLQPLDGARCQFRAGGLGRCGLGSGRRHCRRARPEQKRQEQRQDQCGKPRRAPEAARRAHCRRDLHRPPHHRRGGPRTLRATFGRSASLIMPNRTLRNPSTASAPAAR